MNHFLRLNRNRQHEIAMIVAEHEREKVMNIDLTVKYDLAKRVYEAEFGDTLYPDAICVMAGDTVCWLPTNEDGWMVLRSGFAVNEKQIPEIDLMSNPVEPDSVEGIFYQELTDEVALHFEMERADYEANVAKYIEVYPKIYDRLRRVRTIEDLTNEFPEYLDVLVFYLDPENSKGKKRKKRRRTDDDAVVDTNGPDPKEPKEPKKPKEPKEPVVETPTPEPTPAPDPKPDPKPKPPKEPKA